MARKTRPLTDTKIKAAKPKDTDDQLYEGNGLTLLIKSSGLPVPSLTPPDKATNQKNNSGV